LQYYRRLKTKTLRPSRYSYPLRILHKPTDGTMDERR
jgi:hypothetical protein